MKKKYGLVQFVDHKGITKLVLPDVLTVTDLVRLGLRINLVPKEKPQTKDELRNKQ